MAKLAEPTSRLCHRYMHRRPGGMSVECNVRFEFLYVHPYLQFGGTVLWNLERLLQATDPS
jgi:hypothetical protein